MRKSMHIWLTMIFKMKSMKRLTTILFCLMMVISVSAQEQKKFSPEKFQADLEAYITREAHFDMFLSNSFGLGGTNSSLIIKNL